MIKIKIKDKPDLLKSIIKCKNYSALECIFLLDTSYDMLKRDFNLSNEEIKDLLKEYRDNLKEQEND